MEDNDLSLIGKRNVRIFKYGNEPLELTNEDDFNFLLSRN